MGTLKGKVAVVTGSSRGIGRGTAIALGELGATVYVTGRTTTGELSIGESARLVDAAGGHGVAVEVDHGDDAQIAALFAQVDAEQGHLDVFVEDETGKRLTTRLGPWECIACPAGVIHGYQNDSLEPVYFQVMIGRAKPETMGYADDELYKRKDAHLKAV